MDRLRKHGITIFVAVLGALGAIVAAIIANRGGERAAAELILTAEAAQKTVEAGQSTQVQTAEITRLVTEVADSGVVGQIETNTPLPPPTPTNSPTPTSTTTDTPLPELIKLNHDGVASSKIWNGIANNAVDGRLDTYWNSLRGQEQWFEINYREPKTVAMIRIFSPVPFSGSRVDSATLVLADGTTQEIDFKMFDEWEEIILNPPVTSDSFRIVANELSGISGNWTIYEVELHGLK